jgi:hypothetical protein
MVMNGLSEIYKLINPLLGQRIWKAWLGEGNFLILELGSQINDPKLKRPRGEWTLWVYMAAWRLETSAEIVTASEDEREKITVNIKQLEGLGVESIEVIYPSLDTTILFENGITLKIFSVYSDEETHWKLFMPNDKVLLVGPSNSWIYGNSNEL